MKKMNRKGFTIVELVIVIAVIAILAAVLIPTFSGIVDKANGSKALQEVKNAYTVYVSDTLSANETPVSSMKVVHENGTVVEIIDGKAAINKSSRATEFEIFKNAAGETSLKVKCASHTWSNGVCSKCKAECQHVYADDATTGASCANGCDVTKP